MREKTLFYCQLLEDIDYDVPNISLPEGKELVINHCSKPVIKALRKKYAENSKAMLITQLGVCFLFSFEGFDKSDEDFYRP